MKKRIYLAGNVTDIVIDFYTKKGYDVVLPPVCKQKKDGDDIINILKAVNDCSAVAFEEEVAKEWEDIAIMGFIDTLVGLGKKVKVFKAGTFQEIEI